jgi:hypothetical protein
MTDLVKLQLVLNQDVKVREEFLKDPVAMLEKAGLTLSSRAKKELISLVKNLMGKPRKGRQRTAEASGRVLVVGMKGTD